MKRALYAAMIALQSCSNPTPLNQTRAVERPGDPSLALNAHLLSESDFRALLAVAREHISRLGTYYHLRTVDVLSATKVVIHISEPDAQGREDFLTLEKQNGSWRIIGQRRLAADVA